MAKARDTIESPLAGSRIVFLKTATDTNGELLQLEVFLKGGGRVPFEHVHPIQEERVEILSGTARFRMSRQERDVGAGETVVIPVGTSHVWGNPGEEELHAIAEARPALNMETWFETFFGLQRDGKVDPKKGRPNLLQWAVMYREYEDVVYLTRPPLWVQRVLYGLLAPIGKLLGYKDHYPKYSATETASGEGAGPPSTTMVMARGVSMATLLLVASTFLLGKMLRLSKE